jgi:hypothetical protein
MGLVAFVILRAAVVPRVLGQYGHYRRAAMVRPCPGRLRLPDTCEAWHSDVADRQRGIASGIFIFYNLNLILIPRLTRFSRDGS